MIKFTYRVAKEFAITKDQILKLDINNDPDNLKGAFFSKGAAYIDYDSTYDGGEITEITKLLLKNKFIILESQSGKPSALKESDNFKTLGI